MTDSIDARKDWEERIYDRSDSQRADSYLPPPMGVVATSDVGCIGLSWDKVDGAVGYVIECTGKDGEPSLLRHGGSDVAAVAGPSFVVTGLDDGIDYLFRIAAVSTAEARSGNWSQEVSAATLPGAAVPLRVAVGASTVVGPLHPVWNMVGSERLSQLLMGQDAYGNDIGREFHEALRIAHDELGVRWVRAHAIFHDDLRVVRRGATGTLDFDFGVIDTLYDQILEIGLRPVVELSFMPEALASDPSKTVFTYRGIVSPPTDWSEWRLLVRSFAEHLVERYGLEEVAQWPFEVWNEPNLEVFWSGSREDYFRLYDESAFALKEVDPSLQVGGPSSAASEWVEALARHTREVDGPLDFVSTHTYGNLPLDFRPVLDSIGYQDLPIYWTEWGVGSTHFGPVHDAVAGAPFILAGYRATAGRLDALAYWVVSDHFEELGRPPRLFHDGFGLLSVGNLRKPRYWAVYLAANQGPQEVESRISASRATVDVQASRHSDGTIDILLWNGTINTEVMRGDPRLDREVDLIVDQLPASQYSIAIARVDELHSNIVAHLSDDIDWPDGRQWDELRRCDQLYHEDPQMISAIEGRANLHLTLPHPGVARLRLRPIEEAL
ncbi:hypothetical protein [Ferrimicrobium sp.]|uniref:GH39 family glycosyl hydrolase n=1 Tax=Ferrimicrobium sp. TaxID=2926050 RepID=UPI002618A979|nr:hypothetical protein [Ferrimicrobium sp.]